MTVPVPKRHTPAGNIASSEHFTAPRQLYLAFWSVTSLTSPVDTTTLHSVSGDGHACYRVQFTPNTVQPMNCTWLRRASTLPCKALRPTLCSVTESGLELADAPRERRAAPTKSLGESSIPSRPFSAGCHRSGQSSTLHPCLPKTRAQCSTPAMMHGKRSTHCPDALMPAKDRR